MFVSNPPTSPCSPTPPLYTFYLHHTTSFAFSGEVNVYKQCLLYTRNENAVVHMISQCPGLNTQVFHKIKSDKIA